LVGALLLLAYYLVTLLIGVAVFFGAWVYSIDKYGFFLGVGLGWFPSAVIGALAALLWPLVLVAYFKWPDAFVRTVSSLGA